MNTANAVSVVIVTYNRRFELLRCLTEVVNQTYKPLNILVVNNASTDNTMEALQDYLGVRINLINDICIKIKEKEGINYFIINKSSNTGGSGGFYIGLKLAREILRTNFYWLMDDDGYPNKNCLEMLMSRVEKYDYIMPASINIEKHEQLSWATRMKNGKKTFDYDILKQSWGEIMDYVTPFNGVLLSKKCVDEVGYINKDFFLWGDEYDHYWRCKNKGFKPVTLLDARFYHPAQKLPLCKICFGLFSVPFVESPLRMICLVRNYTYIYRHYNQKYKILIKWVMYWWFFIITRHGDFKGWKLYKAAVKDGFKEDFTRHLQYIK